MNRSLTESKSDLDQSSRRTLAFRFWLKLLDTLLRPTIVGHLNLLAESTIYVLNFRSIIDIAVLQLATQKSNSPSPFRTASHDPHEKCFFCMRRSAGFSRRLVMFRFSERFLRLHEHITLDAKLDLHLVPVTIFWARVKPKQRSMLQALFSERSNITLGFRRLVCLLFNRTDVLIHFGEPISWQDHVDRTQSVSRNVRTVARFLRNHFHETQQRVVGPENPARNRLADTVLKEPSDASTTESRTNQTSKLARSYFHTISTKFSYPATKAFKMALRPFWSRCFSGIRIDGLEELETDTQYSLIYVPNHRSHLDYVLLSYVLFQYGWAIPHVASGDNLNMPVVGGILRRVGAFYIKRSYHDLDIYRNVLESYLYEVVNLGNSLEFFIEGTRSRTGWMLHPQFGFARLLLEYQQRGVTRPLAIVPVFVAYERSLEIASHRQELQGSQKRNESVLGILRNLRRMSRAMGTLSIRFGAPIPVENFISQHEVTRESTSTFAYEIVRSINSQAVLNAMHLVCLAIGGTKKSQIKEEVLVQRIDFLQTTLRVDSLNHQYQFPRESPQKLLNQVIEQYTLKSEQGRIVLSKDFLDVTFWFRNNVLHTLLVPAIVTHCVLQKREIDRTELVDHVTTFSEIFSYLLIYRHDEEAALRWTQHLENSRILVSDQGSLRHATESLPMDQASLLSRLVHPWFLVMGDLLYSKLQTATADTGAENASNEQISNKLKERFSAIDEEVPIEFHPKTLASLDASLSEWIQNRVESEDSDTRISLSHIYELFDAYTTVV